jgi:hypothetical protein
MPKPYDSEFTLFMREWLEKHPDQSEEKRKGRALWWDKPQDPEARHDRATVRVPVKSYYYDLNH